LKIYITFFLVSILTVLCSLSCKTVEPELETNQVQHIGWWRSQILEFYEKKPYTNQPPESIAAVILIGEGFDAGKPWIIINPEFKYKPRPYARPIEVECFSMDALTFLCNSPVVSAETRGAWHAIFCGADGKLAGIKSISSYSFKLMPDKNKAQTKTIKDKQISDQAVRELYQF